ncbi:MAG: EAL domain-containing protein, partial [Oscillospiraceae bacterium]|nr:EAL domain-containing protein [Oscillospiraceae bacterium]
ELETLISLGIDLIQGYYTSKPNPVLPPEIPAEIRDKIISMNLKSVGYTQKACVLDSDEQQNLAELAVQGYTDIIIGAENVYLTGNTSCSVSMRISCPDGYKGTVNICGVNVFGLEAPVLTLGKNCDVTLNVDGKNCFSYEGIRVPSSSSLTLNGDGQLNIDMNNPSGVVIGGDCLQDFGSITVDISGSLNITSQSGNVVAIGGGFGGENSSIDIVGGLITAELKGVSLIGIGTVTGNVGIRLWDSTVDIDAAGQNVIAVGSKSGKIDLECNSVVTASCSGDNCCCFGSLENGSGGMVFNGGSCDLTIHSKNSVAIGSVNGNTNVRIDSGEYNIFCEGNSAAGIGDCFGSGNVTVAGGTFKMHIAASTEVSVGSAKGKTVISGGSIVSDSREKIKAVNPYGAPLEEVRKECGDCRL